MGDCWFLASLAATLYMGGPLVIELMMFDLGSHVLVRLHDMAGNPLYLRIEKSLVRVRGGITLHSTGGLWPAMMEKAMSGYRKTGDDDSALTFDPDHPSYSHLAGGSCAQAFKILLGVDATYETIDPVPYHYDDASPDFAKFKLMLKGEDLDFATVQQVFGGVAGVASAYVLYYVIWSRWIANAVTRAYADFMVAFAGQNGLGGVYRYNDFATHLNNLAVIHAARWNAMGGTQVRIADAVAAFLAWVRARHIFAEKRGTGLYNAAQLALFERIRSDLARRSPLCFGTRQEIGTAEPVPGSSGEPVSRGLAGRHAYAILDTHTDAAGRKYVQVFNPWGRYGRGYSFAPPEVQVRPTVRGVTQRDVDGHSTFETDSPVFWLELADVTKRCNRMYYCVEKPAITRRCHTRRDL